jgi:hypothetical protein
MEREALEQQWQELVVEVTGGLQAWRASHPAATLSEIEQAVDARWQAARAQLVTDLATASAARQVAGRSAAERPTCPDGGRALVAAGRQARSVTLYGDHQVRLERDYARCPACGAGLFPPGAPWAMRCWGSVPARCRRGWWKA